MCRRILSTLQNLLEQKWMYPVLYPDMYPNRVLRVHVLLYPTFHILQCDGCAACCMIMFINSEYLVCSVNNHSPGILPPAYKIITDHHLQKHMSLHCPPTLFKFFTCINASKPPSGLSMLPDIGAALTCSANMVAFLFSDI